MNREIKYRAWDKSGRMIQPFHFMTTGISAGDWTVFGRNHSELKENLENPYPAQQFEIMQFTGLKDKNNIDIYEGDILSFVQSKISGFHCGGGLYKSEPNNAITATVKFADGAFYLSGEYYPSTIYLHQICTLWNDELKVPLLGRIDVKQDRISGYDNATYEGFEVICNIYETKSETITEKNVN